MYSCCIVGGGRGGCCSVVGSGDARGTGIGGCYCFYGGCGKSSDIMVGVGVGKVLGGGLC